MDGQIHANLKDLLKIKSVMAQEIAINVWSFQNNREHIPAQDEWDVRWFKDHIVKFKRGQDQIC